MRIPLLPLQAQDPVTTEALRINVFVQEVRRQADTAIRALDRAMLGGLQTDDPTDWSVFGDIQAMLFSAIIVNRILWPTKAPGKKSENKARVAEIQRLADDRGRKLRDGSRWTRPPRCSLSRTSATPSNI